MSPLWNLENGEGSPGQRSLPSCASRKQPRRVIRAEGNSLEELARVAEDDDGYIRRAKHAQLVSFLEQAVLALEEGDGPVAVVGDGCD